MTPEPQVLRKVAWNQLFPWLLIFRSLPLSLGLPILACGTLGTMLTPIGWQLAHGLLGEQDSFLASEFPAQWPPSPGTTFVSRSFELSPLAATHNALAPLRSSLLGFRGLFQRGLSIYEFLYLACGCLWTLLIWAALGGIITRIALVRLGCDERVGLQQAVQFVRRRYLTYFLAPIFPLLVCFFLAFLSVPLGWILRLDLGAAILGCCWGLALLAGAIVAVLTVGLAVCWPFQWCATSYERQGDLFEANQRAFSYACSRPLHYLFYAALAGLCGIVGWVIVSTLCEVTIGATAWLASWGAGNERLAEIAAPDSEGLRRTAQASIAFWHGCVRCIATGYPIAFLWTSASAIYLLLRKDVDQTDFDEEAVVGPVESPNLPQIKTDEGVPEVIDTVAESTPPDSQNPGGSKPDVS